MSKLSLKVAVPVILAGIFAIVILIALYYDRLELSYYVVFFLLVVCIFFFGFAIGQGISQPVKKLLQRAEDLSQGNLTTRVYLESKDEFGELARIFNKIAQELEESHCDNEKMEKSVDIKVRARTQALEETIDALEQKIKNRTIELEKMMKESERLEQEAKEKEIEAGSLKRELDVLQLRVGKYKPKKASV